MTAARAPEPSAGVEGPIARFRELLARAQSVAEEDPTATALATVDSGGRPSVRFVLLRGFDARGFVFYTSYDSRKARDLAGNPRAALCFHWPGIAVQVRVEGEVERVSPAESDAYFAGRPRAHQLAAWSSEQSRPLPSREALLARFREVETRFAGREVPRPPQWGGYRLVPDRIEFWHGYDHRLHDRLLYTRSGSGWAVERLQP